MATPAVLAGEEGLVHHEEQPRRSLIRRPDARSLMGSVILDIEILSDRPFRCILLCSGLIAQGRILFSPLQDPNDDVMDTIFDVPNNLEDMSAGIKSTLDILVIHREQLDNPNQLLRRESHVKLSYEDKGLRAIYEQNRKQASLRQPPSWFTVDSVIGYRLCEVFNVISQQHCGKCSSC
ncbi:hypothetical protein QL093DRAFT_2478108 [Fusarium oxysporum]|nr:hypothetical protein QL093DRAFT_2478108 [Fusarium oxysporum]